MDGQVDWGMIRNFGTLTAAVVSLCLAVFTLYVTQFKSADIKMSLAKKIRMGGTGGGGFQLYVPITFANNSHRPGSIERLIILLKTQTSKTYQFEFSRVSKLDDEGKKFVDVGIPGSLPVLGKTSSQSLFRFVWWDETLPKFELEGRSFDIVICAWNSGNSKPDFVCNRKFVVDGKTYENLKSFPTSNVSYEISAKDSSPKNSLINDKTYSEYVGRN